MQIKASAPIVRNKDVPLSTILTGDELADDHSAASAKAIELLISISAAGLVVCIKVVGFIQFIQYHLRLL